MKNEEKWAMMHAHRKAVALDLALPIKCPDCGDEMVPVKAKNDGPALRCMSCRVIYTPGHNVWDQIKQAVKEAAESYE